MNLSLVPYISPPAPETLATVGGTTYRECLKNHAAAMGGQAFDGCGEFMPVDSDPLKCAACGCHRNFHRREISDPDPVSFFSPQQYYPNPERGGSDTPPRRREMRMKRYRTKFTAEQKEKMRIFAEKLGWRIQKHDGADLEKFCVQIGVNRHVLKIWMHNHKNNPATTIRV